MTRRKSADPPPPAPPVDEIALMEAKVRRMREMGVTEWGDIKLGPTPAPEKRTPTAQEIREAGEREEERRRDVMFAASHIKPRLRAVKS